MPRKGTPRSITIGDKEYTIQRFKGLKAIMAMAVMTRIAREVPDVMADAVKEYQRRNTVTITEAMARLPRWSSFTTEDFDAAAERNSGRREIDIPAPMTGNEQIMYALPKLLEEARKEVVRLLALMVIPNEDLRKADKEDSVEVALDEYEDLLMGEAELDELIDICLATQDVLKEQLAERADKLGNLMRSMWNTFQRSQGQVEQPQISPEPTTEAESTQQTSPQDAPTSSTDSEEHTDGAERPLSLTSPGSS